MAQTLFINITVDKTIRPDGQDHTHQAVRAAAAGSDITVSIDLTNVKTITQLRFALNRAIVTLQGGKELTP